MFNKSKRHWEQKKNEIKTNLSSKKVLIEIAASHPLKDGDKPGMEFESRLIKGIELYYKEKARGNEPTLYVPGSTHYIMKDGEKQTDLIPLAEAGKKYLLEHGIPLKDIRANNANIKYQGEKGVYNSGDECLVASKIYKEEGCGRLISVVSPVQVFRKALFYNEFGINPEIYSVPLDKTAHNYIGETFWSLYVTTFLDHTWQGENSFLSVLTRKERFDGYKMSETETDTLENKRIVLPQEVLDIKKNLVEQYKTAQENVDYNVSIPFSRTLIELSDDKRTYKKSIMEAIKIAQSENEQNRNVTICCKTENEQLGITELLKSYSNLLEENGKTQIQLDKVSCIVTDNPIQEYNQANTSGSIKYGRFYKICNSDKAMSYSIDAIQKGVVPLVVTVPSEHDDYISATFDLYDKLIGKDLINELYQDKEDTLNNRPTMEER